MANIKLKDKTAFSRVYNNITEIKVLDENDQPVIFSCEPQAITLKIKKSIPIAVSADDLILITKEH